MRDLTAVGLSRPSRLMRVLAPAKLNLHLRVAPPDPSGFHPLMTWMCTIGLFDTLTIEPADPSDVSLHCDDPSLPCDGTNLIVRAARALGAASGNSGARIHLEKRIPAGGGLGGGSSDAGRTLLALNRLWTLDWNVERLAPIGAALGSDVPFFLSGSSSICTGRGELVRPIAAPKPRAALLILPGYSMPTPSVYQKFDEQRLGNVESVRSPLLLERWTTLNAQELLNILVNDLEPAAFAMSPGLAQLHQQLEQQLGRPVRMSGSGSTLFTLFDELGEANAIAARIKDWEQTKTAVVPIAPAIADDLNFVYT